jgi:hypothetical protein
MMYSAPPGPEDERTADLEADAAVDADATDADPAAADD